MPAGRRRSAPKASAARPPGWTVRSLRPIGKGSSGIVMRFHGVCRRLVAHPLHENRLPGDTLFTHMGGKMETVLFVVLGLLVLGSGLAASGLALTALIAVVRAVSGSLPPPAADRALPLA